MKTTEVPEPVTPTIALRDVTRSVDFEEFRVCEMVHASEVVAPVHRHARAQICCVLDGVYRELADDYGQTFEEGTTLLRNPGAAHENTAGTRTSHSIMIEMTDLGFKRFEGIFPRWPRASKVGAGVTGDLPFRLQEELATGDRSSPTAIQGLVLQLLARLQRSLASPPVIPEWLFRAMRLIETSFREPLSLRDVASAVDRHPAGLAREFRRLTGSSVGERIRQLKFDFALRVLAQGTSSVAEVAAIAGYADQAHFTREFRKRRGITPSAFRREHRHLRPDARRVVD